MTVSSVGEFKVMNILADKLISQRRALAEFFVMISIL
jgi:hypothetical protein